MLAVSVPAPVLTASAQARPAGWSAPQRFAGPVGLDASPLQVSFAPSSAAAIGYGFLDPGAPGDVQARLALTGSSDRPQHEQAVPRARRVLDVGAFQGMWTVLAGTSGGGQPCCTAVEAVTLGRHGFGAPRPLLRGLQGVTLGRLVVAGSRQLAVFASPGGVWAALATRPGTFGRARRLTGGGVSPESLVAMAVHGSGNIVAWTQSPLAPGDTPAPPSIVIARGAPGRLPAQPRVIQTLPAGTSAGPLALAPNPWRPTLGWAQDTWSGADNRSQVVLADVGARLRPRVFAAAAGQTAWGVAGGADSGGDEVFAWESCDASPTCQVMAVSRPAGGYFGVAHPLGAIDASAVPAVAVGRGGAAAIGWIQGGQVTVIRRASAAGHFRSPVTLASTAAADLRLAAAPDGAILAVWAEGAARSTLWAAQLR